MKLKGYIGSCATKDSQVVLQFEYDEDTMAFSRVDKLLPYADSKYMSLYYNDFVTLMREEDRAGIALWNQASGKVETLLSEEITSCYVTQDDRFIYTANYHEGHVLIYDKAKTLSLYKKIAIQEKAGCHQVILRDHYILVPCLMLDTIRIYDRDKEFAFVKEISFPKGSGPRHGVFDFRSHAYVVCELSCQLYEFVVDSFMDFRLLKVTNLLNNDEQATAAAIRLTSDKRFLYVSIRGVNQIVVYDVNSKCIIQRVDSGGDHPRDMVLSPDDKYLFVLHRFSNDVRVFSRQRDGFLLICNRGLRVSQGVCILLEDKRAYYEEK